MLQTEELLFKFESELNIIVHQIFKFVKEIQSQKNSG